MRQGSDRRLLGSFFDLRQTREPVAPVDVHRARAADPFSARAAEGERRIHLVFDFDQGVENHGAAVFEIDLVVLELGLAGVVGVPSVDLECLEVRCFSAAAA